MNSVNELFPVNYLFGSKNSHNFCCTRRNFQVIPQKLLTNSWVKTEPVVRGYKAEPEQTAKDTSGEMLT